MCVIDDDWMLVDIQAGRANSMPVVSGLLRLPAEIRQQIYAYALSGNVVPYPHAQSDTLRQSSLQTQAKRYSISREGQLVQQNLSTEPAPRTRKRKALLALLLTSRQLYREALPTLYATNTFYVQTPWLFHMPHERSPSGATAHLSRVKALRLTTAALQETCSFLRTVPAPVLSRISRLLLDCCGAPGADSRAHIPHGAHWRGSWAVINGMRGLRELEVWICGCAVPLGWQRTVLAPLREVTHVPLFNVYVPWPQRSIEAHTGAGVPFRLRTYGDEE